MDGRLNKGLNVIDFMPGFVEAVPEGDPLAQGQKDRHGLATRRQWRDGALRNKAAHRRSYLVKGGNPKPART
jgi:hypothetical protein